MALIKCVECKKEISDKSESCIHCGCPVEKILLCKECGKKIEKEAKVCRNCGCPVERNLKFKKPSYLFARIWLVICSLVCFLISWITFANVFSIDEPFMLIGDVNIMGVLATALGIAYIVLLITLSWESFYLLLGINLIILILNLSYLGMAINLGYIICVFLNSLITFFVVRKILKKRKFKFVRYLPIFIALLIAVLLPFVIKFLDLENNIEQTNVRNLSVPQIEIITEFINLRSDKSVNADIIGEVYYGEIYTIISEDEESDHNWYEIETSNGIRGFVAGRNYDDFYVRELEMVDIPDVLKEEENKKEDNNNTKKENTTGKKPNNKKSNKNNNSNSDNNEKQLKTCDESAKKKLTDEYETTLAQREKEYQTNYENAKQKVEFAKEGLDLTGGYLSSAEYDSLYSQATSSTQKELLKTRYNMSVNYDKMVDILNALPTEYNRWKETYKAWYQEELGKLGC